MTSPKILTDGSVYHGKNKAIAAFVIKQGDEELASGLEEFEPPNFEAEYAEARAVRIALQKALQLGIKDIRIGCDNRNITDAIKGKTQLDRYGDIRMIKKEAKQAETFGIYHLPREDVQEAHNLCRSFKG